MKNKSYFWNTNKGLTDTNSHQPEPGAKKLSGIMKGNKLTAREVEVLEQLREGHTYKQAAVILEITTETLRKHATNIYTKLEVKNRTQALKKYFV